MSPPITAPRQVDGASAVPTSKPARRKSKAKTLYKTAPTSMVAAPVTIADTTVNESPSKQAPLKDATKHRQASPTQAESSQQTRPLARQEAEHVPTLTPLELSQLKSGRKVAVLVGESGNEFIAIEAAYGKVLSHYSQYFQKALGSSSSGRIFIPRGDKNILLFIYRWMLAGEQDSNAKGAIKFEDLRLPDLIALYYHCASLDYQSLKEKTSSRLEWKLKTVIPTIDQLSIMLAYTPPVAENAIHAIARLFFRPVCYDFSCYLALANEDHDLAKTLDDAIGQIRAGLVKPIYRGRQRRAPSNRARNEVPVKGQNDTKQYNKPHPQGSGDTLGSSHKAEADTKAALPRRRRPHRNKPKAMEFTPATKPIFPDVSQGQENAPTVPIVVLPRLVPPKLYPHKAPKSTAGDAPPKGGNIERGRDTSGPDHFPRGGTAGPRASLKTAGQATTGLNNADAPAQGYRRPRVRRTVDVFRNGEGITTSSQEAMPGELTRTGLVI